MPDLFRGTTALVTGASRGIGAALARQLALRGTDLILVARQAGPLAEVAESARHAGVRVTLLPGDLADPATPAALERAVAAAGLTVDHLVNNAGLGPPGRFHELPVERQLPTVDVNVRAVTELAARFLPGMVRRGRGGLLNVASTAAWQGLVWLPVYSASKAFVVTWSEAVWATLRGSGVRCCCVSPGPVDTGFFAANDMEPPPAWITQSPDTVARRALRAYQRDDCHVLPFLPFRLAAWGTRLVPRAVAARLGAFYAAPRRR
jgi:uncharacterized protein